MNEPPRWAALPGWSLVRLQGADSAKLLHNLCTNDILALQPGQACEAAFTDVKGRVKALGLVLRIEEAYWIALGSRRAAELTEHLERYHIREEVTLEADPPGHAAWLLADWPHTPAASVDIPALQGRWRLAIGPVAPETSPGAELTPEALETLRIESRFPLDGVDLDPATLPQEIARDRWAISFRKGCYLGQETVARIDALGHVNKLLVGLRFAASAPSVGATLTRDGQSVGRLTSVAPLCAASGYAALGYVRRESALAGAVLETAAGPATVLGPGD